YEALSYVWGDPAKTESMTLNGMTFGLSANLKDALINLRERDTERTLWVDALCINQDDDTEKHREVMRMRAIYYSAKRVVVWLGDAVFDSNMAIEWAEQIHLHFKAYLTRLGAFGLLMPYHALRWKALHRLLSRPWFGRAW
ncbi:heterokaryon incompatibility, partial [Lasiosphaeria miniovina]